MRLWEACWEHWLPTAHSLNAGYREMRHRDASKLLDLRQYSKESGMAQNLNAHAVDSRASRRRTVPISLVDCTKHAVFAQVVSVASRSA